MEYRQIEWNDLMREEGIQISDSSITENDVIVIPKVKLSEDDIVVIKKIRASNKKVLVHNLDQTQFKDFRGGEFALALLVVTSVVIPIITAVVANWIMGRMDNWKMKKKENEKSEVTPPDFKMEFYVADKKKYVKIEGDSETSLKALDKLKDL